MVLRPANGNVGPLNQGVWPPRDTTVLPRLMKHNVIYSLKSQSCVLALITPLQFELGIVECVRDTKFRGPCTRSAKALLSRILGGTTIGGSRVFASFP